jgi:hypothetical protein
MIPSIINKYKARISRYSMSDIISIKKVIILLLLFSKGDQAVKLVFLLFNHVSIGFKLYQSGFLFKTSLRIGDSEKFKLLVMYLVFP